MTEKRFTLFDDGETIFDNESVADDEGKQIYWTVEYGQRVKLVELLNELHEEKEYLQNRLNNVERELYCKDRILEEKGIDIECCDKNDSIY